MEIPRLYYRINLRRIRPLRGEAFSMLLNESNERQQNIDVEHRRDSACFRLLIEVKLLSRLQATKNKDNYY